MVDRVEGDRISLQIEDWLPIAILPISETRAVARHDRLAGTWMYRDGSTFRFRIAYAAIRLERQQPR